MRIITREREVTLGDVDHGAGGLGIGRIAAVIARIGVGNIANGQVTEHVIISDAAIGR